MPASSKLDVRPLSRALKALSDETRLRIVAMLSHSELCVCHLESALSLPQSNTSRHLSVLKAGGLVESRREGSWVYYRLAPQPDELCRVQLQALVATFASRAALRRDVARVRKACGPSPRVKTPSPCCAFGPDSRASCCLLLASPG